MRQTVSRSSNEASRKHDSIALKVSQPNNKIHSSRNRTNFILPVSLCEPHICGPYVHSQMFNVNDLTFTRFSVKMYRFLPLSAAFFAMLKMKLPLQRNRSALTAVV